jgi:hypothetical protein
MEDLSLRVKWMGHEADNSPPSLAKGENMWSYTTPPNAFIGCIRRTLSHFLLCK